MSPVYRHNDTFIDGLERPAKPGANVWPKQSHDEQHAGRPAPSNGDAIHGQPPTPLESARTPGVQAPPQASGPRSDPSPIAHCRHGSRSSEQPHVGARGVEPRTPPARSPRGRSEGKLSAASDGTQQKQQARRKRAASTIARGANPPARTATSRPVRVAGVPFGIDAATWAALTPDARRRFRAAAPGRR